MKQFVVTAFIAFFLLLPLEQANAMNLIGFKVCLATEMKASVTHEGKPAAGAKIIRTVTFDKKSYITEVETDASGKFILPALYERYPWKLTKFVVFIKQKISVNYKNESHLALEVRKQNFDYDGELNNFAAIERGYGKFLPYEFSCELTNKEPDSFREIEGNGIGVGGKCLHITELQSLQIKK